MVYLIRGDIIFHSGGGGSLFVGRLELLLLRGGAGGCVAFDSGEDPVGESGDGSCSVTAAQAVSSPARISFVAADVLCADGVSATKLLFLRSNSGEVLLVASAVFSA